MKTELQLLKRSEGKIKSRAFLKDGELVWKKFEDPWSPLVSDRENNTEDDVESRGDEDLGDNEVSSDHDDEDSVDNEALSNDDNENSRDNEASSDNDDEDLGDNGAPSDDEPKRHKRMRSEKERDSEDDGRRDDKRKRAY